MLIKKGSEMYRKLQRKVTSLYIATLSSFAVGVILFSDPIAGMSDNLWDLDFAFDPQEVPVLDFASVHVHWAPSDDRQTMDANVTWHLNVDIIPDMAVVVRFVTAALCGKDGIALYPMSTWMSCETESQPTALLAIDVVTKSDFAVFKDVLFGTKYYVRIGLQYYGEVDQWETCKEEISPSCNSTFYSGEVCTKSCNALTEPPNNLSVDSVINNKDNVTAAVTLSWLCPVQHDVIVEEYYVIFNNLIDNSTIYYTVETPLSTDQGAFVQQRLPNLVMYDKYQIVVVPVVSDVYNQTRLGPPAQLELILEPLVPETTIVVGTHATSTTQAGWHSGSTPSSSTSDTENAPSFTALIGVGVVVCLLLISVLGFVILRRVRKQHGSSTIEGHCEEFEESVIGIETDVVGRSLIPKHEFPRHSLHIENELGRGNFGIVYKATADGIGESKENVTVAVKMLKDNATAAQKDEILREITTLQEIGRHPNILGILGCCTTEEPYFLITEYMKYGDLLHFLWRSKEKRYQNDDPAYSLAESGYYQIARQIARGMEFLAQNKYVHGDLAARNVLVGEDLLVKISDFGLANDVYLQGWTALPTSRMRAAKWVSLETNLKGLCTIQSDVWSFGVVLYEIATQGETPYQGMSASKVVAAVKEGYRMPKPEDCPEIMYAIMRRCWLETPDDRPTFCDLFQEFDQLLSRFADYINEPETVVPRSPEDVPLLPTTIDTQVSLLKKRDNSDILAKHRRSNNYSTEESAFCESTSTTSFGDYMAKNSDIEDFSDEIVFEAMSESDNDEGFFL